MKFKSDIEIQAGVNASGSTGDPGQILSSTGTGVAWIDQNAITSASDFVFFNVKNETGSTILKGKGVMAVGTDGNSGHILIDEMVANGTVEAKYFLGVLEENIANGGFARAISFGQLDQFNTTGQNGETWNDGQILWCDPANPGDFTITEPDGPNVKIAAAFILNSSTNGKIQIRVQANEGVHDLHDTKITSQVDGDVLVWDNTTGVWFNDSTLNVDYAAGNVGIGTTSPNAKLDIHYYTSGGNDDLLNIGLDATNPTRAKIYTENYDGNFGLWNSGSTQQVKVSSDGNSYFNGGNVGIGTASPNATLKVQGPVDTATISTSSTPAARINNGGAISNWIGANGYNYGYIQSIQDDGTNNLKPLALQPLGGNVGIGTTNPGYTLDVSGNIRGTGNSQLNHLKCISTLSFGNFTAGVQGTIFEGYSTHSVVRTDSARLDFYMGKTTTGVGTMMSLTDTGNVGIGTTSPATKLDVDGVITATGGNSTQWNTAYTDRNKWDGGATGLIATTGRASLGLGTLATLNSVNAATITDNSVGAAELNVSGDGTTAQYLRSDGDGTFTWVTPPDNNTTYTAGGGLVLNTTEFSHADTSTQASVDNSSGIVIQDVTLDTYGHVTGLASVNLDGRYYTEAESDSRFVNVTGDTMTGTLTIDNGAGSSDALVIKGTSPTISFLDDDGGDDFYIHVNSNNFYVLVNRDANDLVGTGWESPHPLQIEGDTNIGYLFDSRIFADNYHPNADAWTTARTITIGNTGKSVSGSANVSWTLAEIGATNEAYVDLEIATRTPLNDIRSLGTNAFTNGTDPNITTAQVMAEIEGDGGFDSYSSVFKTSWSYAGNYNLTDAGNFTETAGSSWITWTDNSSDTTRGNITALAIAPNTGASAGGVFIYNDQGSGYSPGWRQVWTSTTDGSGSGLDADLLDGQQGSYYAPATGGAYLPLSGGTMSGTLNMNGQTLNMVNGNITAINNLTFNDPGPNEGIEWNGGNGWKIYESPDNLTTNSGGSLQFVTGSTRRMTIDTSGNVFALGSSRAPLFYDNNNTGYFLDPAAGSELYNLTLQGAKNTYLYINPGVNYEAMVRFNGGTGGTWYVGSRVTTQLLGSQDAYHVYSSTAGQTVGGYDASGNHYALASTRTPIFYDSNNTGYYLNPASTSNLNTVTAAQFNGPLSGNASTATTATRSNAVNITGYGDGTFTFYQTSGTFAGYSGWANYFIGSHGNGSNYYNTIHIMPFWGAPKYSRLEGGTQTAVYDYWTSEGVINSNHAVNAPIFYDSNNTVYYIDGASTSSLNSLNVNALDIGGGNIAVDTYKGFVNSGSWTRNVTPYGYIDFGPANSGYAHIYTDRASFYFNKSLIVSSGSTINAGDIRSAIFYDVNNTAYYLDPASTGTSATFAGNVGIGTTSPDVSLAVKTGSSAGIAKISSDDNGARYSANGHVQFFTNNSAYSINFFSANKASNLMRILDTGNVGIGTTSPGYKLDVSGTGRFTSTVTASNFILSSDKTLKDNISDINTDHVNVKWKNFELKSEPGVKRAGVVAQELEENHPEFVRTDKDGIKSVAYIDLLIAKIAELEARLEKAGL